jgi:hypothetical protein
MEVITIETAAFQLLLRKLEVIEEKAKTEVRDPYYVLLTNQQFCELLQISKRTAQNYRDSGLISFVQIDAKVYYRLSEVHKLLDAHTVTAFKSK